MTSVTCEFTVAGDAVAQPRHRFRIIPKAGGKPIPVPYLPGSNPVHGFKANVATAFRLARPANWPDGGDEWAYRILVAFVRSSPKRLPKKRAIRPCNTKPDLDNLLKSVKDALTDGGQCWDDDGRVYDARAIKVWAGPKQESGVLVVVQAVPAAVDMTAERFWAIHDTWAT